jgi:hypothetical protein
MEKKNFLGEHSTLAAALVMVAVLLTSLLFSSCNKDERQTVVTTKGISHSVDTIVVQQDGYTFISTLDTRPNGEVWGVVNGTSSNGETETWQYPLGAVEFTVTPNDTTLDVPTSTHTGFTTVADSTSYDDMEIYHIVKHSINFTDQYTNATYTKTGEVTWKNGSVDCWGYNIPFPRREVTLEWLTVAPSEVGSDANFDYTLFTTTYNLKYLGAIVPKNGFHTTKREKGSDVLVDSVLHNHGWQPLTYTSYGWPATALSWIEVVYNYSQSGPTAPVRKEIVLQYGCAAPADTTVVAPNFNLNWANPSLGQVVTTGTSTTNGITITSKKQNYAVGASGLFTRRFVYTWQTAKYGVWDMPSPAFTGHSESHTLTDLSPVTGYDRKLATNTASASLNGISGNAPAKTTVKVESTPDTPDDPTDELVSRTIIDEGLTYVNETTNKSWIKIREVWTVSGTQEYTVDINLTNGVTCPAEGPVIVADFNYISQPGAGTTSSEQLVNSYTNGNFTVKVYRKTYTVNLGASVQLVWTGTYEKAVYNPLNHAMPSSSYSFATAVGEYTSDLGPTLTQNTTYNRKLWTQNITATLNAHTHQHAGTCEVWALDEIPRESPELFGNLLNGKFTRIQQVYGGTFHDCVAFLYENGVALFIDGNTSNPLYFAKTATVAAQLGIPQMGNPNAWYSAEYHNGSWWPAKINVTGDWDQWVYVADANNTHTVMKANALECGIGYECKAIPTHQSFTKNGNVGTISYSANNTSSSMTASITFW